MLLKYRLSLAFSGLLVFILMMEGVLLFYSEKEHLASALLEQQKQTLGKLVELCRQYRISGNDLVLDFTLMSYFSELTRSQGVEVAAFVDSEGKVVNATQSSLLGKDWIQPGTEEALSSKDFLRREDKERVWISHPVQVGDSREGMVQIVYSKADLYKRLSGALRESFWRFVTVTLAALFAGLLAVFWISRSLTRPLEDIAVVARRVGGGDLDVKIGWKRHDEIGALAATFNRMISRLRELDQLKEDFVSTVTHEMRAPMHAITGFADVLLRGRAGPLEPKQEHYIRTIQSAAERLGRFINNILDLAKLEAGLMELEAKPISVCEVVEETSKLLSSLANEKGVEIISEIGEGFPRARVDRDHLAQIFTNLIANAVRFTPSGGKITLWGRGNGGGDQLEVGVRDTGPGIPKEDLVRIFSKFEQVRRQRDKKEGKKGTGLGLAIVERLVKLNGGTIKVKSELGKGADFIFTLPS